MATKKKPTKRVKSKRRVPQFETISGLYLLSMTLKNLADVRDHLTQLPQQMPTAKLLADSILFCQVGRIELDHCIQMLRNAAKRAES